VIDGTLNNGGDTRRFGWGRFNPTLQDIRGADKWVVGKNLKGDIQQIRIYKRALKITEAIANYRAG
jgi:hypothetical protein